MELTCVQLAGNQRRYQLKGSGCCPVLLDVLCTADPGDLQAHTHTHTMAVMVISWRRVNHSATLDWLPCEVKLNNG